MMTMFVAGDVIVLSKGRAADYFSFGPRCNKGRDLVSSKDCEKERERDLLILSRVLGFQKCLGCVCLSMCGVGFDAALFLPM